MEAQEKRIDYPSKRVQAEKNHIFVLHYVFLKNLSCLAMEFGKSKRASSLLSTGSETALKVETSPQYK